MYMEDDISIFNCVLYNYIKHIHKCNHWLSYFKLHDILHNFLGQ